MVTKLLFFLVKIAFKIVFLPIKILFFPRRKKCRYNGKFTYADDDYYDPYDDGDWEGYYD